MICNICHQIFTNQISFKSLYHFQQLCRECNTLYHPLYKYEVIPIDDGVINYYSVFNFSDSDPHKKRFLYRHMKLYFLEIYQKKVQESIILFIDDAEYLHFPLWFPIIKQFKWLRFYSLFYFDFCNYEDFV